MAAAGVSTVTCTRGGLTWRVPVGDAHIGFGLFVDGGFEQDKITALLTWLSARGRAPGPDDVVVDIGANIGSTSIVMARARGCRVLAIEPARANFELLRDNVELNELQERVMLVHAAVMPSRGTVMVEAGDDIGAAAVRSATESGPPAVGGAAVTTAAGMPLADALSLAAVLPSEVSLVWADVQGSETTVINTGADLWERGVPLWAEYEPGLLARHGGVEAFFAAAGTHFDRFIEARDLLTRGAAAVPQSTARLAEVLSREPLQTDVLLLPARFQS